MGLVHLGGREFSLSLAQSVFSLSISPHVFMHWGRFMCRYSKKSVVRDITRNWINWHLDLGLHSIQNRENKFLLTKPPIYFVMGVRADYDSSPLPFLWTPPLIPLVLASNGYWAALFLEDDSWELSSLTQSKVPLNFNLHSIVFLQYQDQHNTRFWLPLFLKIILLWLFFK